MLNTNAVSPLMITKAFLGMLTSDPSFVINVSSDRASYHDKLSNTHANYGYRASKAALNMYTFCSTWDLPNNVKTFAVHPGNMKTDMNPTGIDNPNDQTKSILQILDNWEDSLNGKFLNYDGNLYPL
jgi:NAD(P)-dependent dehydrogenase (short-subunit alcohol dehydrogenase family)